MSPDFLDIESTLREITTVKARALGRAF